jgi:hypothetical protein
MMGLNRQGQEWTDLDKQKKKKKIWTGYVKMGRKMEEAGSSTKFMSIKSSQRYKTCRCLLKLCNIFGLCCSDLCYVRSLHNKLSQVMVSYGLDLSTTHQVVGVIYHQEIKERTALHTVEQNSCMPTHLNTTISLLTVRINKKESSLN